MTGFCATTVFCRRVGFLQPRKLSGAESRARPADVPSHPAGKCGLCFRLYKQPPLRLEIHFIPARHTPNPRGAPARPQLLETEAATNPDWEKNQGCSGAASLPAIFAHEPSGFSTHHWHFSLCDPFCQSPIAIHQVVFYLRMFFPY